MFEINEKKRSITVLRFSCPVRQAFINKVTVVEEFRGFLRTYAQQHQKHLLINLQDRNAWQEVARSQSIETLQKNAEFSDQLIVATLPKNNDFYYQNGDWMNQNEADRFIAGFQKELFSDGFFFPPSFSMAEMENFYAKACIFIHQEFFKNSKTLTRRNREDFIEIFYQLILLKWIEMIQPDSISLTCKDSVDTGASALATFCGFLQILTKGSVDMDFLRYLFYSPALFVRERVINSERLGRALCALELIANNQDFVKHMDELYHPDFLKHLKIIDRF